jgi:hypothetical protein
MDLGAISQEFFLMMYRIPQKRKKINPFAHNAHVEVIRTSSLKQKSAH